MHFFKKSPAKQEPQEQQPPEKSTIALKLNALIALQLWNAGVAGEETIQIIEEYLRVCKPDHLAQFQVATAEWRANEAEIDREMKEWEDRNQE